MKILRSWLNDYVEIKQGDQELADLLTFSGTLVDSIEAGLDNKVIVAKILEINPHPNADKLHLVKVDTGKESLAIVCGASNIEMGQIVPLATIGTKLGDFEIKEAVIRGEKSSGMLCSEKELGLGENHSGIKILPNSYEIGEPLNKYLESDSIFDLEVTPNRGDCLSHLGVAREISVLLDQKLNFNAQEFDKNIHQNKLDFEIKILNPDQCQRYFGMIIKNIKIGPSPDWLKDRLERTGLKSINNVVDITNYIMFDLGQPLHAFDAKKLVGGEIIIRNAKENEEIITIDGERRALKPDMLVIADGKNPIAVAGVMGGLESEIDKNTTDIILESAEFERKSIRKTSKDLKVSTEASYRFERGIDREITETALNKAGKMISLICGGEIVGKISDVADGGKNDWISVPYDKINDLLGINISKEETNKILKSLGFKYKEEMCQAPSWRHDIALWQDLAEEVARIYGFSNIKYEPIKKTTPPVKGTYYIKEHIKDILVEAGFSEVYTYPFLSEKDITAIKLNTADLLEIANPVQSENKYLRKSLLPGLLKAVAKNPAFDPVLVFEIGNVFTKSSEKTNLTIIASGKAAEKSLTDALSKIKQEFEIKEDLNISETKREDLLRFKIKKPATFSFEIGMDELLKEARVDQNKMKLTISAKPIHYRPISRFPSITRDMAFIVDKNIAAEDLNELIYRQSHLINRVELFDEFASDKFGAGKKNVAFHLDLQHQERTLTDKEAKEVANNVSEAVKKKFNAELRTY